MRIVERTWAPAVFSAARVLRWLLLTTGRGSGGTLPGRVALMLHPAALSTLSRDRAVVLVSGTNGKSTTTALLAAALAWLGPVVTNSDGSNLPRGLVSSLLVADPSARLAALEVDEMLLGPVLDQTRSRVVVLLNLSRDQLDRVEEVSSHVRRWADALKRNPETWVVANSDDPLVVASVHKAAHPLQRTVWVAAGSAWIGDVTLCPVCGQHWDPSTVRWACAACGFSSPEPGWTVGDGAFMTSPNGAPIALRVSIPGRSGISNAAMAVVAAHLAGVPVEAAAIQLTSVRQVDGRYQQFELPDREVTLLLGKNPAGWLEVLHDLQDSDGPVLIGINAQLADGVDPSWLWDVGFEVLEGRDVTVFGDRKLDLAVRLTYAGVAHQVVDDLPGALAATEGAACLVAANYTAFVAAREELRRRVADDGRST